MLSRRARVSGLWTSKTRCGLGRPSTPHHVMAISSIPQEREVHSQAIGSHFPSSILVLAPDSLVLFFFFFNRDGVYPNLTYDCLIRITLRTRTWRQIGLLASFAVLTWMSLVEGLLYPLSEPPHWTTLTLSPSPSTQHYGMLSLANRPPSPGDAWKVDATRKTQSTRASLRT